MSPAARPKRRVFMSWARSTGRFTSGGYVIPAPCGQQGYRDFFTVSDTMRRRYVPSIVITPLQPVQHFFLKKIYHSKTNASSASAENIFQGNIRISGKT
jgi:hypothetical protein